MRIEYKRKKFPRGHFDIRIFNQFFWLAEIYVEMEILLAKSEHVRSDGVLWQS